MKKGFTLVEILIAISLFTLVAIISSRILVDVVQLEKKSSVQTALYEDARLIMQQLTNEIQAGTIDYEEYYSMNVVQVENKPAGGPFYGLNYGIYSSRFFDPGKSLWDDQTSNPDDLGIECSFPEGLQADEDCEVYYTHSGDLNTGQNPFKQNGSDPTTANALCDEGFEISCATVPNTVDELYLIDSSGIHKTIIGIKKINDKQNAIGIVRMTGHDLDQNGIIDVFGCDEEFKCFTEGAGGNPKIADAIKYPFVAAQADPQEYLETNKISLPQKTDLAIAFEANTSQFVPITPQRVTVTNLEFIINPLEDPYKAYAETTQTHPTVTVVMTLGLSEDAAADYPGDFPDLTIQSTVAVGVIGKIESYPPVNDVLTEQANCSWINDAFGISGGC